MALGREYRIWVWLAAFALLLVSLWLLSGILLPFVVGMAISYFLDPLAGRLERLGLSRTLSTLLIIVSFFGIVIAAIFVVLPLAEQQVVSFAKRLPDIGSNLLERGAPIFERLAHYLSPEDQERVRSAAGNYAGTVVGWIGTFFTRLLSGSLVIVNVLSLIFITPVVAFYLLRDWRKLTGHVDRWLPRPHARTIREQLREIDVTLAGFARGQATVCLILGLFYGIGLSLVGLDLGLVVGLGAGLISFVPYLGTVSGFIVGIGLAFAQEPGWHLPLMVAGVFIFGNLVEGNYLSPKLVGEQIGVHPVWIIFALLAGGALFGFLGILLAMPVAAVVGVLTRFFLARYMESPYYRGDGPSGGVS